MFRKKIDWSSLSFSYHKTDKRFVANYKDGKWEKGKIISNPNITMNESACVLQYAQTCFEGLKAYKTKDDEIVLFRPELNAKRLISSCQRLEIPTINEKYFLDALKKVVLANKKYIPPYGSHAALYLRPFVFGISPVLGVKPALEYQFRIFTTPVGPYFKSKKRALNLMISEFDRAAPRGTGDIKAGLNYGMSIHSIVKAHNLGFDENLYLDSATRTKIEETGGANIIFVTHDHKIVTPKSNTILPSITKRSLLEVAHDYLGLEVEEREIFVHELNSFKECGLCGTAAVISPVGKITYQNTVVSFDYSDGFMGEITKKLYQTLIMIQYGEISEYKHWLYKIK